MGIKGKLLALVMALVLMLAVAASAGAELTYKVDAPSGYKTSGLKYPVVYVMPQDGYAQDNSGITSKLFDAMDKDISMDVIVVRPTFTATDNVHDVMAQIIAEVDAKYPTIADSKYRAVVGTAVGGQLAYELTFMNKNGKVIDTPDMFGFVASINGNFDESFFKTFTNYVNNIPDGPDSKEDNAAEITEYLSQFYSYLDTPVDSEWANDAGSTNDLGQKYINWGVSSSNYEYTARLGNMTDDFLTESVNRVANRLATWSFNGVISGNAAPVSTAVSAKYKTTDINYNLNLTPVLNTFASGNVTVKVTVSVIDSETDEVLSTKTKTHTLSVADPSVAGVMSDMNIDMKGSNSTVEMSATLMGGEIELSSTDLVYFYDPEYNGDYQTFDLMGDDWHFKYFGSANKRSLTTEQVMSQYESWNTVLPALGNWKNGYGGIVTPPWYGDYGDFFITGDAYYVKTFTLPKKFNTTEPVLSIGYVDDRCEVWFNGKRLGGTGINDDGTSNKKTTWAKLTYFELDPSDLVFEGEGTNTVIVRAYNDTPYGAGGWYGGPVGLYSMTAYNQKYGFGSNKYFYEESFYSDAIGADNDYIIYLPENYYDTDRFYPTMYLLHQFNSDHSSYMTDKINEELNEAIKKGLFDEMIVVIPNSSESSWWKDEWEDMVVEDLIPHIEANYRVIPDARYRLTAGCSMGGQGAFSVALRNPNEFSGAAAFFGAFDYGDYMGSINPITLAKKEGAEYMDYFTMAFICGNQDDYGFGNGKIEMNQILEKYGIDHYFFIENGGHNSDFYLPYFQDTIAYVRDNMYKNTSGSAASLIGVEYAASSDELVATFTADEAIRKYFNVIPASKYTENTNPGLTIPVIATIKYEVKPGALAFLYATALAETKEAQVKFNVTFDDDNLIVTENVSLKGIVPEGAAIHNVKFHTQLLGRDHVSDSEKVEELKVYGGTNLPSTGDNSNIFLFAALLMMSVVGMTIMGKKKASC